MPCGESRPRLAGSTNNGISGSQGPRMKTTISARQERGEDMAYATGCSDHGGAPSAPLAGPGQGHEGKVVIRPQQRVGGGHRRSGQQQVPCETFHVQAPAAGWSYVRVCPLSSVNAKGPFGLRAAETLLKQPHRDFPAAGSDRWLHCGGPGFGLMASIQTVSIHLRAGRPLQKLTIAENDVAVEVAGGAAAAADRQVAAHTAVSCQ